MTISQYLNLAILRSLSFPQMLDRRTNITQPYADTCEWIWKHTEFTHWQSQSNGLVWITGKAGSGKSTLMAYLYENLQKARDETSVIYLDFFFNASGVDLQRSPLGMLRSLLNQLFVKCHRIRPSIRVRYQEVCEAFGVEVDACNWLWQRSDLEKLLHEAILESAKEQPVAIFIDALDEAGDTFAREISSFLHDINDQASDWQRSVRMCVSCRPYPIVAKVSAIRVHVDQCNADAVRNFVTRRLDLDSLLEEHDPNRKGWQSIIETIIINANGLFQWVRLVVAELHGKIIDGRSPSSALEWLAKTPLELSGIYTHIMQQILQRGSQMQSLFLFQWVLFSKEPPSLTDFRYAMIAYSKSPRCPQKYEEMGDFVKLDRHLEKLVKNWSGGLIEPFWSNRDRHGADFESRRHWKQLQVTHTSIKDFLISKGISMLLEKDYISLQQPSLNPLLPSHAEVATDAYLVLYQTCLNYILHESLQHTLWNYPRLTLAERSPFILDACGLLMKYAQEAQASNRSNINEEVLALQEILPIWSLVLEGHEDGPDIVLRYVSSTTDLSVLHVACSANLVHIVDHLLEQEGFEAIFDGNGRNAMHVAAAFGALSSAKSLYRAGFELWTATEHGDTPLSLAAARNWVDFIHWLLKKAPANGKHVSLLQSALCPAAWSGNTELVELLLDCGVGINVLGMDGSRIVASALHFAASRGQEHVVRLLLERGASLASDTFHLGHVMYSYFRRVGSLSKRLNLMKLLLEAGADPNPVQIISIMGQQNIRGLRLDPPGMALGSWQWPLYTAAQGRSKEIVQLLLLHGATVDRPGLSNFIVEAAIASGCAETTKMLIRAGAKFGVSEERWQGALLKAAQANLFEIVQMILDEPLNAADLQRGCSETLLIVAKEGSKEMVKLLLDRGANINYCREDENQETPLVIAAKQHNAEMVKYLISNGADALCCDSEGNNLLHMLAGSGLVAEIDTIRELKVPLDAQNVWGWTPLLEAMMCGDTTMAILLLDHGANPHARDIYGTSPCGLAQFAVNEDVLRVMKRRNTMAMTNASGTREHALRRSIQSLATALSRRLEDVGPPGIEELGQCLLRLGNTVDAYKCFQDSFRHVGYDQFAAQGWCQVCQITRDADCRYICTVCYTDVCLQCLQFRKADENAFGQCFDHEFLTIPAPTLADFPLSHEDTASFTSWRRCTKLSYQTRQLVTDLVDRYSSQE